MRGFKFMPYDWNVFLQLLLAQMMVVSLFYISDVDMHRITMGLIVNIFVIIGIKLKDPDGRSLPSSMMKKIGYAVRGETPPADTGKKESGIRLNVLTYGAMVATIVIVYEAVVGSGAGGAKLVGDIAFAAANGLVGVAVMMAQPKPPVQTDEDTVVEFINEVRQGTATGAKAVAVAALALGSMFVVGGQAFAHDPDSVGNDNITPGVVCSTLPGVSHGCDEDTGEADTEEVAGEEAVEAQQEDSENAPGGALSDGEVLYEAEKTICITAEANIWLRAFADATGVDYQEDGEEGTADFEFCQTFVVQVKGGSSASVTAWVVEDPQD